MKSILIALCFLGMSLAAVAQSPAHLRTSSFNNFLDTVANTASKTTVAWRAASWKTGIVFEVIALKISGTVAGTIGIYGSLDGTNWVLIGSTTSASDASANYRFATTERWYYYQVKWVGSGTMSASFQAYTLPY